MADAPAESLRTVLASDTDQALAWTREARKGLSPGDPEDALYLRASGRLAQVLRQEFPGVPLGRALMSAAQSLDAIDEHLTDRGIGGLNGTLSVLSLAAEQLAREDAEAGRA